MKKKKPVAKRRGRPISFHGHEPEDVLKAFMDAGPPEEKKKKVKVAGRLVKKKDPDK